MLNVDKEQIISGLSKQKLNSQQKAIEWLRCKSNPFYFIYNYVYILEHATGASVKLTSENLQPKMKRTIRSLYRYQNTILMASRQLGKSSIAACMISWACVCYPGIRAVILNMKRNAGLQNLRSVKFIIENLPSWMVTNKPLKSKSDIVTYLTLFNDSHLDVFYPSTYHDSSTVARSLTVPILYIDEAAYIRDMFSIYGSAQQTLSKAREQAQKENYPTMQFITSTPNGVVGDGEWFYKRWQNCVDSDLIFDGDMWDKNKEIDPIVFDPSKNSFVGIKYHWSEDPTKNENWYKKQCQEIDDDRTINQELDLLFVGTQHCLFSDNTLASFEAQKPVGTIETPNNANVHIFEEELDKSDYYLMGCDTAESLEGAYCAIQIFSFRDFQQVAELEHKYGSYTLFAQDIDFLFKWLKNQLGNDNIILCNENNSIGRAPIEHLLFHTDDSVNYLNYLYVDTIHQSDSKKKKPLMQRHDGIKQSDYVGIKTTGMTKPLMIGCLLEYIKESSSGFKSQRLINQLSNIERTNSGTIRSSGYTDLFMASCFCAYVRNKKALEIMPIISMTDPSQYGEQQVNHFTSIIGIGNINTIMKESKKQKGSLVIVDDEAQGEEDIFEGADDSNNEFLPFFTM